MVDSADLAFWQGDAESSGNDFLEWQQNLGRSWLDLAPPSAIAAVPEPSAIVLAAYVTIATFTRRRKHRDLRRGLKSAR